MLSTRRHTDRTASAARWTSRLGGILVMGLALLMLAACDDSSSTGPGDEISTIEGSVESSSRTSGAQEASAVAAAAVNADGSLDVLAEAEIQADGSFTIEGVPAGRSGLVVTAEASDGEEVGRVLVHGETEGGATITTEPINGETTVEGLVHSRLSAAGVDAEVRNTARLALLIRIDESTVSEVAASAQAIQEVAAGVQAGAEAQADGYADMGADASAQNEALASVALQHAQDRQSGVDAEAAHEAFARASVDAFAQGDADDEDVSLATAAAATGLDQAMALASEEAGAHLELAKNAVELNLTAREELAADLESSDEQSAAASALADARVGVEASASPGEIAQALLETEESAEEELTTLIMARIPDGVSAEVRSEIETRLQTALAEADLSASVEASGAVDPRAVAQAVLDYRQQLRSAVEALVAVVPDEVGLDADATTSLFIAARGGPSIGS